ncbi:MAG: UDP-N-acetylmuramoyl-tripeptide--D-alanyl-D-alanine ligase [Pseudomonadota bacterium]
MIRFSLKQAAGSLNGHLYGANAEFSGVSTDSRNIGEQELFVALAGERFDAHDFVAEVAEKGGVGAVVERRLDAALPQIQVADTRLALGGLGHMWRQACGARVVALTGSNGKTTVKEMIAAILRQRGAVLATRGNLNNDIGVPLTLTRLQDEVFAVVEMGANHAGEIDYLTRLTRPHVAVLNNAGRAHLEGFGSVEAVARAKAEILNGLEDGGTFVFPADSRWTPLWRELAGTRRVLTFGMTGEADVSAAPDAPRLVWNDAGFHQAFQVRLPGAELRVQLALAGEHNRRNALAAIAAVHCLGVDAEAMAIGLAQLAPVRGRLAPLHGVRGLRLLDDTYNANPDSVGAALEVLAVAPGRRFLVLGDLGELGPRSDEFHAELGRAARAEGVDALFTLGVASQAAAREFGVEGRHFSSLDALLEALEREAGEGDTVLIKGSRSARMERVVSALKPSEDSVPC